MLGVASIALRACHTPQTPSFPYVGLWSFDETEAPTFADGSPNQVPMTLVGNWADLAPDSMVQGLEGTAAYTDGAGYATLPANQQAHALSRLTVSFYYQRNSSADKHILLAAGDGSEAGDFSIEVLANGRLRGWHTGQDVRLRFFESTGGVTGTNLEVGRAYRIDMSLGLSGVRVFLDGTELATAAIQTNTNGWNNARVKHLGRWTDGVLSPADGAFDRFRLWSRELSAAEIAELEPAQPTLLPGEYEPGEAPLVPSLAEWLVSDEADPPVTKYVSDQSRGNGSGSTPANAQEVQAALDGASPGDVLLAVCQVPGEIEFWDLPGGLDIPAGSSGNPVTLQARQGDGVVVCKSGDMIGARAPNSGFWTQSGLSQADIDKRIWRSVDTFSGGAESMIGWWIEFDHPHQLMSAQSMTNLRATYGQNDSPTNYSGPMVHKDIDNRIYIRMQKPHPVKYSRDNKWSQNQWRWKGHPEAISNGRLAYPVSENPNDYPIYVSRFDSSSHAFQFASGGWAKVGAGINSYGYRWCLGRGSHDIWCDRGTHYSWNRFIRASNSDNNVRNYFMNRTRTSDGSKRHACLSEWKFGGWQESWRSACLNMFSDNSMSGVYWKDCTIGDWHEIFVGAKSTSLPTQLRFRNCTFVNTFDDGFQARYSMCRVEVGYCFYLNSDWGGMGASGSDGAAANPNEIYIHHNIIDCRGQRCTNWRAQPHSQDCYSTHSADGNNAYKIYNNMVLTGPDRQEEQGIGFEHAPGASTSGANAQSGASGTHQAFNNVIILQYIEDGVRYDPVVTNPNAQYSDNFQDRSDFVGSKHYRWNPDHSNELMDYNLYYRDVGAPVDGMFRMQSGSGSVREYDDLADWWDSGDFASSKSGGTYRSAYANGWEGSSTNTKPALATLDNWPNDRLQYRPAPTSAVTVASNGSLNGQNWWSSNPGWGDEYLPWTINGLGLEPSNWKGPLDPNGSTMPVGVRAP